MSFIKLSRSLFSIFLLLLAHYALALDVMGIGTMQIEMTSYISETQFKKYFASEYGIKRGELNILSYEDAESIISKLPNKTISPGGETSGVLINLAKLGASTTLSTKLASDTYSDLIMRIYKENDVDVITGLKQPKITTSIQINLITPDGTKTKVLLPGTSANISQKYLRYDYIKDADYLLVEASLWDGRGPKAKAVRRAINCAKRAQKPIVFLITDAYYTSKYRNDFLNMLPEFDIVIGNTGEFLTLLNESDLERLEEKLSEYSNTIFVIPRKDFTVRVIKDGRYSFMADTVAKDSTVDTAGVGVVFAAGFLYEYDKTNDLEKAGLYGLKLAQSVVKQAGASNIIVNDEEGYEFIYDR